MMLRIFTVTAISGLLLIAAGHGVSSAPRAAVHDRLHAVDFSSARTTRGTHLIHRVSVDIVPSHVLNTYDPLRALGAGVDAQNAGAPRKIYTRQNVAEMTSSGLGAVTYRLYTELGVQGWHWNPTGTWSERGNEGYWIGASAARSPQIADSYGYRLPHRGDTHDQANDDDYGRLDDGDTRTYWKSDPYLDASFTGDGNGAHPQWVVVDLGRKTSVDAARIVWSNPYASAYDVQYWTGDDAMYDPAHGRWVTFSRGAISNGSGGNVMLQLAPSPRNVRFVRVLMTASSNTCDTHGARDTRNCVGYAIGELGVGTLSGRAFKDAVKHAPNHSQTTTYASSTDPWHAAANRVKDEEQAGLDLVFTSGITRGLPAIVPVAMLYGTPDDAAAELRYLEARGYPVAEVELGEEPDGQYATPEDYGALYVQWVSAIRAVDPTVRLGGPVFQGTTSDVQTWADTSGNVSWLQRFLAYLSTRGRLSDLGFMSFEWYPFGPCSTGFPQTQLVRQPSLVSGVMQTWRKDGLPPGTPVLITETNYSANTTEHFQDISGALWYADATGAFLANGASGFYLYQYEPDPLFDYAGCPAGWGSWGMWNATRRYTIKQPTSEYFAAQLLTQQWSQPADMLHAVYPASTDVGPKSRQIVSAYAVERPDGQWSVMLVNKNANAAYDVTLTFSNGRTTEWFSSSVAAYRFGPEQYVWNANGKDGSAHPDGPYATAYEPGGAGAVYRLPAASITVLRGTISATRHRAVSPR